MINTNMNTSKANPEALAERYILDRLHEKFDGPNGCGFDRSLLLTPSGQQLALRQFFLDRIRKFAKPVLVTLTFKNPPFKDEDIRVVFDRFIERLSKRCFKHAYRRFKKKVDQPIAVWERDATTRLNIHAVIECPEKLDINDFMNHIDSAWVCGTKKFQDSYIDPERGLSDWVNYMCKFRSKDLNGRSYLDYMLV